MIYPTESQIFYIKIAARLPNEFEPSGLISTATGDESCDYITSGMQSFSEQEIDDLLYELGCGLKSYLATAEFKHE